MTLLDEQRKNDDAKRLLGEHVYSLHSSGTAAPVAGTYARGSIVWNAEASASGKVGWVCVAAGTPGTWKAFGVIDA